MPLPVRPQIVIFWPALIVNVRFRKATTSALLYGYASNQYPALQSSIKFERKLRIGNSPVPRGNTLEFDSSVARPPTGWLKDSVPI